MTTTSDYCGGGCGQLIEYGYDEHAFNPSCPCPCHDDEPAYVEAWKPSEEPTA